MPRGESHLGRCVQQTAIGAPHRARDEMFKRTQKSWAYAKRCADRAQGHLSVLKMAESGIRKQLPTYIQLDAVQQMAVLDTTSGVKAVLTAGER
jgi:hypothetical protein